MIRIPLIPEPDEVAAVAAKNRWDQLTKPIGSLGQLELLGLRLAAMQGSELPTTDRKTIILAAGDHGVTVEGISAYPSIVTQQMIANFLRGGACINALARQGGIDLVVADVGVDGAIDVPAKVAARFIECKVGRGTRNMAIHHAMGREDAINSIEAGRNVARGVISKGADVIGVGDMGVGNTTASTAILCSMLGLDPHAVTGPGTGLTEHALIRKAEVVKSAVDLHRPDPKDPIDVLAKVGGFEIGALAGCMIEAALKRCPVVLDGLITGAAALIAHGLAPGIREFLIAAHCSFEPGHRHILTHLGLTPLLDLELRLGEGSGAAMAMGLLDAVTAVMRSTSTFSEAGVAGTIHKGNSLN